ncbi:MAG: hypothetical protein HYS13_08885 [Planctomycetia bacterium]|nr:hypothetical protein [Planctomycetia bacterium]
MRLAIWPALVLATMPIAAVRAAGDAASPTPAVGGAAIDAESISLAGDSGWELSRQPRLTTITTMLSEPWSDRTYFVETFSSLLAVADQHAGDVELDSGMVTGVRFGRELGLGLTWMARLGLGTFAENDLLSNEALTNSELFLADVNLVSIWDLGSDWTGFFSIGAGVLRWDLPNDGDAIKETAPLVPISLGLSYELEDEVLLRLALEHNVAFGDRTGTVQALALSLGLEFCFEGPRRR